MDGILFAYFGPETTLPLTSLVAAGAGTVMMFGRGLIRLGRRSRRKPVMPSARDSTGKRRTRVLAEAAARVEVPVA